MKIENILEASVYQSPVGGHVSVDPRLQKYAGAVESYLGVAPKFRSLQVLPVEEFDKNFGWKMGKELFGLVAGITTPNRDVYVREGSEDSALHELVHAAGFGNGGTLSTFLNEGFTQLATEQIGKLHAIKVPKSYAEEVKVAEDIITRALAEDVQQFFRRFIKAKDKAGWLASALLKKQPTAFDNEEDWGPKSLIKKKLVFDLSHMIGWSEYLDQLANPRC